MKIIKIGRSQECELKINDSSVSRMHARVIIDNGDVIIEDLNSANGTYVNNQRVKLSKISRYDILRLGNHQLDLSHIFETAFEVKTGTSVVNRTGSLIKTVSIGRANDNDIIINDPHISSHHAVIRVENGRMTIQDSGSMNGTFVNRNRITSADISFSDDIQLGSYKLNLERFRNYFYEVKEEKISNVSFNLTEGANRIGRAQDNDVIINHPMISAHHAVIIKSGNSYVIEDLNSTNGVYVNGNRVHRQSFTSSDKVTLGIYPINISSTAALKTYRGDVRLDLNAIDFIVKNKGIQKQILHNINLTVFTSEFVGLIGPSGSGKTTLMNIINGYVKPSRGEVVLNQTNLHENYDLFRGNIGYVPQDDIIHRELTVNESLFYSAKLRLPADTTNEEIEYRVDEILKKLDILKAKHVIIGSPEKTGISGGQRKRVNLAQELITQPSILLLDEPTSGLDPKTDSDIMKLLRILADEGRIILLTTHHITESNFKLFDNLILLTTGGRLAFYGPAYPDSVKFFDASSPSEIFTNLELKGTPEQNEQNYKASHYQKEYVEKRKTDYQANPSAGEFAENQQKREFGFTQFFVLLRRYFSIKKSDTVNSVILLLQAPILGLLIGLVVGKPADKPGLPSFINPVFVMIICSIFFGVLNTSREIVSERAIYFRERMVMLKIPSYLFSKFFLLTIISIIQSVTLVTLIYYFCGLEGDFFTILITVTLVGISSMSLGFLLSSFVKTPESAVSISIFALIPQIIFGGAILPFGDMKGIIEIIAYIMLSRWAFEIIVRSEADAIENGLEIVTQSKFVPETDYTTIGFIAITGLGIIFLIIVALLLKRRDKV